MEELTKKIIKLLPFQPGQRLTILYKPFSNSKYMTKPVEVVGVSLSVKKEGGKTITKYYYIVKDNEQKNIAAYIEDLFPQETKAMQEAVLRNTSILFSKEATYKPNNKMSRDESIIGYCDAEYKDRRGKK